MVSSPRPARVEAYVPATDRAEANEQPDGRAVLGKIVPCLAVTLAVGGDCPADIALLRGQPRLFGPVASDPAVSRRIDKLAADIDGNRITCFVTNTRHGQLAHLEHRHRHRARCEDRIRCGKGHGPVSLAVWGVGRGGAVI